MIRDAIDQRDRAERREREYRDVIREIRDLAKSTLADGGMHRTKTSVLMEINRLAAAKLQDPPFSDAVRTVAADIRGRDA